MFGYRQCTTQAVDGCCRIGQSSEDFDRVNRLCVYKREEAQVLALEVRQMSHVTEAGENPDYLRA